MRIEDGWKPGVRRVASSARRALLGWLALALLVGGGLGLFLGAGASASQVCDPTHGVCLDWYQGPGSNQTTVVITDNGAATITFSEILLPSAAKVSSAQGSPSSCTPGSMQNTVNCPSSIAAGATETVVITTTGPIATGSTGSVQFAAGGGGTFPESMTLEAAPTTTTTTTTETTPSCPKSTISPTSLRNAIVATNYAETITDSGGTAPYTYSVSSGALPPGLTLNSALGALFGSPTTAGAYSFVVTSTDAKGCKETASFAVAVAPAGQAFDFGNAPWDGLPTGYDPGRALSGHFPSANKAFPDFPPPAAPQDKFAPFALVHKGVFFWPGEDAEGNAKQLDVDNDGIAIGPSAAICANVVHHGLHKVVRHYTRPLTVSIGLDGVAPKGGEKVFFNFWADLSHAGDWNGGTNCHGFTPDHQLVNLPLVIPAGERHHTFHLFYRQGYDTSPYWTRSIVTLKPLPRSPNGDAGGEQLPGKPPGFIGAGEIEDWFAAPVAPPHGKPGPAPRPGGAGGPAVPGAIYGCSQGNGALGAIFYSHYIPLTGHTEIVEPCSFPPGVAFTDPAHAPTSIMLCLSNDFGDFALLPGAPVPTYYVWTISQPRCIVLQPGTYTVPGPQYILFPDGTIPRGQWFAIISSPNGQWIPGNTIIVYNGPYM